MAEWLGAGSEPAGECSPPLDVLETAETLEVVMDVPGVAVGDLRVIFSRGMLVVAGRKAARACAHGDATFHLAERTFGRFARAVRLTGAVDAGRATARLAHGELHIVVPRIEERRGRDLSIPVTAAE